jgi:hypothetical protein
LGYVLFSTVPVFYVFILANNWLGYILGGFLTNSSGHPCGAAPSLAFLVKLPTSFEIPGKGKLSLVL